MGFASGFAQGFMNTVSSGIENENKNRLEKERDFDRIAATNIFETAKEYQKEHARVTSDLKKKAERFNAFLPFVNNNEAAAEALANSDTHTGDIEKISEIGGRFMGVKDYKSPLLQQMQDQLKKQQDLTRGAIDKANGMIPKGSKATPFEHPDYSPMEVRQSTLPPQQFGASNKVTSQIVSHIVNNSRAYDDINEAVTAYKVQFKAAAPHAPMPSDQEIIGMFQGMKFGGAGKPDPAEQRKLDMTIEYVRRDNPNLSEEEVRHKAQGMMLGMQPKLDPTSHESLKKNFLPLVDPIIAAFGKAQYTIDPYGNSQMAFVGVMQGDTEKLIKARGYAMGAFRADMKNKKTSRLPQEYAYYGLWKSGYWDKGKTPEEAKAAGKAKYEYEIAALEAANAEKDAPPTPVDPNKNTPARPAAKAPAPTAPGFVRDPTTGFYKEQE